MRALRTEPAWGRAGAGRTRVGSRESSAAPESSTPQATSAGRQRSRAGSHRDGSGDCVTSVTRPPGGSGERRSQRHFSPAGC